MTTPPTPQISESFEHALKDLINTHGIDVYCATTDYILAAYITGVLEGLRKISLDRRARWAERERQGTN
jgi:hypothetical protein